MTTKDIQFLRITYLAGPNIWTYRPALEAWVDIGEFEDFPSHTLPGFVERLTNWLPGLAEHRCGIGEPGGFILRLKDGTWMGHILEHVTLELQNLVGMRTGFGKARSTSRTGLYKVVVRSRDEQVSRACMQLGRELLLAAVEDRPFDLATVLQPVRDLAESRFLGPSTACIVDSATERRIPSIRLSDGNLVQLGHGARSHRIWTAETDLTSAIAEGICSDKDLTKSLLGSCGVPVPEGRLVDSPDDAWDAAQDIGLPVVVKPVDGNHGRGVFVDLTTESDVKLAYERAQVHSNNILVERSIPGNEHRLLVVGNKVVAAARGESAWITGDGRSTIRALIDSQLNSDPRRGETEDCPLNIVKLDDDSEVTYDLARQGFAADSVPADGQRVLIQRNGNVAFDCTDTVHPGVAAAAALAARVVGLDIAGIDLVAEDISRPLREQGGAIVEVNAGPGLLMHLKPATGEPRPVGRAIVDYLFGDDRADEHPGRIPIIGVSGSKGKSTVAHLVARMIRLSGRQVGLAAGDGLYFDDRCASRGDCANREAANRILLTRSVQAAVIENSRRSILSEGVAYDRCAVGVITNIDATDLDAEYFIENAEQLTTVFRTQVDLVLENGAAVLNANDPLAADLARYCDGEVIFFSRDADAAPLANHLAQQGRAVVLRDGQIELLAGNEPADEPRILCALRFVPMVTRALTEEAGKASYQAENVLAAIATAWALNISIDLIRAVVTSYVPDDAHKATAPTPSQSPA